jgi:hypothetical protein
MDRNSFKLLLESLSQCEIFVSSDEVVCSHPHKSQKKLEVYLKSKQCWDEFNEELVKFMDSPIAEDNSDTFMLNGAQFTGFELLRAPFATILDEQELAVGGLEADNIMLSATHRNHSSSRRLSTSSINSSFNASFSHGDASANRFGGGESLLKVLLRIRCTQTGLLCYLMNKLLNLNDLLAASSSDGSAGDMNSRSQAYVLEVFNLIRWCEQIYECEQAIEMLMQVIDNAPRFLQIEIITALPLLIVNENNSGYSASAGLMNEYKIREAALSRLLDLIDQTPGTRNIIAYELTVVTEQPLLCFMFTDLLPCVLCCISNLSMPTNHPALVAAVKTIGSKLATTTVPAQLPTIAKFLIEHTDTSGITGKDKDNKGGTAGSSVDSMFDILLEAVEGFLITVIDFEKKIQAQGCSGNDSFSLITRDDETMHRENKSALTLVLDVIKLALQTRQIMFTQYLSYLSRVITDASVDPDADAEDSAAGNLDAHRHLRTIDMWIIFALFSNIKLRPKLLTVFVTICNHDPIRLIEQSIACCGSMLDSVFQSILSLAQSCVSTQRVMSLSSAKAMRAVGVCLYECLYAEFRNISQRQELIATLVMHVNTQPNAALECQAALDILSTISFSEFKQYVPQVTVKENGSLEIIENALIAVSSLKSFSPFLKTLLEDVHKFSHYHIRTIFDVLFRSCTTLNMFQVHASSSSSVGQQKSVQVLISCSDEIFIYLKKLSSSNDARKARASIIGYISYISQVPSLLFTVVNNDSCHLNYVLYAVTSSLLELRGVGRKRGEAGIRMQSAWHRFHHASSRLDREWKYWGQQYSFEDSRVHSFLNCSNWHPSNRKAKMDAGRIFILIGGILEVNQRKSAESDIGACVQYRLYGLFSWRL